MLDQLARIPVMGKALSRFRYLGADSRLFDLRYHWNNHLTVPVGPMNLQFDTSSWTAKRAFYPNYLRAGHNEPDVIATLVEKCTPQTCFFDIGANLGFYTVFVAKLCPEGSIHAFELDPDLISEIQRNVELNTLSSVRIICGGAWHESSQFLFFEPEQLGYKSTNMISLNGASMFVGVPSIRIDDYCNHQGVQPDVVKVDVEGAEAQVLRGMTQALGKVNVLLLELHPDALASFGTSMQDIVELLRPHPFKITAVHSHRKNRRETVPVTLDEVSTISDNSLLICERA